MPKPKFTKDEREEVMLKVARLDARARSPKDIALEVGVSPQQVLSYLKRLRRTDLELAVEEVKARRVRILRELDEIKREAWDAWEKSKVRYEIDLDGERVELPANPNPAYMQLVRQALEDERTMLGVDEPKKVETDGDDTGMDWSRIGELIPTRPPADDVELELAALNVVDSNEPLTTAKPKESKGNGHVNGNGKNGKHH